MRLTPELHENRYVHLQLRVEIQSVKEDASQTQDDTEKRRQAIPMISSTYVESSVNVPLDSTLAIGGLAVEQEGKKYRLLCLVRCRKINDDTDQTTSDAKPKTQQAQPDPNVQPEKTQDQRRASDETSATTHRDERIPSKRGVLSEHGVPSISDQSFARVPITAHSDPNQPPVAEDLEIGRVASCGGL